MTALPAPGTPNEPTPEELATAPARLIERMISFGNSGFVEPVPNQRVHSSGGTLAALEERLAAVAPSLVPAATQPAGPTGVMGWLNRHFGL